jgi:hypothetical protein
VLVVSATGISASTIRAGIRELNSPVQLPLERCRRAGGGKNKSTERDPQLEQALNNLIDPVTRGVLCLPFVGRPEVYVLLRRS